MTPPTTLPRPPRVFISYSHDSTEHRERVLGLSERLRKDGIDTQIDQYVGGAPAEGWPRWMRNQLNEADFVLVVCTDTYLRRFWGDEVPGRGKGVDWEGALITLEIYNARSTTLKFVPVFFNESDARFVPEPLGGLTHYGLDSDANYEALYDFLLGQAGVEPGELGPLKIRERRTGARLTFSPATNVSPLHQLPPALAAFTGRETELAELERALTSEHAAGVTISARQAGLQGMGGVGKTALAVVLAHRLAARYPDAQIVRNLRGADPAQRTPVTAAEAMQEIIHCFHPEARLPDTVEALKPHYLSTLTRAGRVLLLLDNAADRAQIEPLLPPPNCLLLVTSRAQFHLPGLVPRNLDCLQPEKSQELLRKLSRRFGDPAATVEAAELCGHLPLALEVFAGAVNDKSITPVPELLARLRARQEKLTKVEAAFQVSYELLTEEQRRCWTLLAVFPATFDLRAATAVVAGVPPAVEPGVPPGGKERDPGDARDSSVPGPGGGTPPSTAGETPAATRDVMQALVNASLVEWSVETSRFRLHDLVRQFCDDKLRDARTDTGPGGPVNPTAQTSVLRTAAQFLHAAHYCDVASESQELCLKGHQNIMRGLKFFDDERTNIEAAFEFLVGRTTSERSATVVADLAAAPEPAPAAVAGAAHTAALLISVVSAVVYTGDLRFHSRQRIRWLESQRDAARLISHREAEGAALANLGNAYAALGDARKTIEINEQSLAIAREIGNLPLEGSALGNLGVAYKNLGDTRKAIKFHGQDLKIRREIGDRLGEGRALGNLGSAHAALGDAPRAIEFYEQRLVIAREIGDRRGEGNVLGNLGSVHAALGDARQAIGFYERSLPIAQEIGDQRGEGNALWNSAVVLDALADRPEAIARAEAALRIFETVEDPSADMVRAQLAQWRAS